MLALQGRPGAFGEGCDKERHVQRACDHYVQGFFSPAPPAVRLAPVTFPNGKAFRAEPAARFALSCLALRAALAYRTRAAARSIDHHVRSLSALATGWTELDGFFAPDAIVAGMHALALAGPEHRSVVATLVGLVAANQDASGDWPNADLFHTLDALDGQRASRGARARCGRAVPALAARQRADGTFGASAQQERALIGLRALLWSEGRRDREIPAHRALARRRLRLQARLRSSSPRCCATSPGVKDARVLVDAATRDDAAVFRMTETARPRGHGGFLHAHRGRRPRRGAPSPRPTR